FSFNLRPVFLDQVIDADTDGIRGTFLAGLRDVNDIPVERNAQALELEHQHQAGGNAILVVRRAAAPYVAVLANGPERIDRPHLALHADRVRVAEKENGLLTSVALESRDEIRAVRFHSNNLRTDSLAIEDLFQIIHHRGLVSWRVAGIDSDDRFK